MLLHFRVWPRTIHILPLRQYYVELETPLFDSADVPREAPLVIKRSGCLWSFANFMDFPSFADRKGILERVEHRSCEDLVRNPESRILFVWLWNKHWEFFLYNWPLIVENRKKRAFFRLKGRESTSICPRRRETRPGTPRE